MRTLAKAQLTARNLLPDAPIESCRIGLIEATYGLDSQPPFGIAEAASHQGKTRLLRSSFYNLRMNSGPVPGGRATRVPCDRAVSSYDRRARARRANWGGR
jgi:hypothetical protein